MRFHLSMNFFAEDCNKAAQKHEPTRVISHIIGFEMNKFLSASTSRQKFDGDKNDQRISTTTITNFYLTIA